MPQTACLKMWPLHFNLSPQSAGGRLEPVTFRTFTTKPPLPKSAPTMWSLRLKDILFDDLWKTKHFFYERKCDLSMMSSWVQRPTMTSSIYISALCSRPGTYTLVSVRSEDPTASLLWAPRSVPTAECACDLSTCQRWRCVCDASVVNSVEL